MTHVAHPYGYRIGITRGWKSRWFASKKTYAQQLRSDVMVREYLEKKLRNSYVSSVDIERSRKATKIIIKTSRPGMLIGRQGEGAIALKRGIVKFMKKRNIAVPDDLKIDIESITNPDADPGIIAASIAEALSKRMPFRRVVKQMIEKVYNVREVQGARIVVSGLIGGSATMARKEEVKRGRLPLGFLRGDIAYAKRAIPGGIGIKVWVYKGDTLAVKNGAHD